MIKKDYIKPAMRYVQLQHRQHLLAGSPYRSVQVKNNSNDDDVPIYDGNSSGSLWDAN